MRSVLGLCRLCYAPGTFLIKALTAWTAGAVIHLLQDRLPRTSRLLSSVIAEAVMTAGYFLYEAWVLSYGLAAATNIPFNLLQGAVCILIANLACKFFLHKNI